MNLGDQGRKLPLTKGLLCHGDTGANTKEFILVISWASNRIDCDQLIHQFSSVQSLSYVRLFGTPGTVAHQAFPSITNSGSLLKLMSIESAMPSIAKRF